MAKISRKKYDELRDVLRIRKVLIEARDEEIGDLKGEVKKLQTELQYEKDRSRGYEAFMLQANRQLKEARDTGAYLLSLVEKGDEKRERRGQKRKLLKGTMMSVRRLLGLDDKSKGFM